MNPIMAQLNNYRTLLEVTKDEKNNLVFEKNVSIMRTGEPPIRCNVYRPIAPESAKFPVLVTYGPYGKDIHYDKSVWQSHFAATKADSCAVSFRNLLVK